MDLKEILERLYADRARYLANDPLEFCHRYVRPEDQEIVGLIASSFAYGHVKVIRGSLAFIFGRMGESPRAFVESFEPEEGEKLFGGFVHRFHSARDLAGLLFLARRMVEESGSIGDYFMASYDPSARDITTSLTGFVRRLRDLDPVASRFFPSPASGSACKRLCMYLRWMARPRDGIDLGLWEDVSPAQLVIPVDTHIQRLARYLELTRRRGADWKTALEVTAALRRFDPYDPVRYDFPLCHLGISEGCTGGKGERCLTCPIGQFCVTTQSLSSLRIPVP